MGQDTDKVFPHALQCLVWISHTLPSVSRPPLFISLIPLLSPPSSRGGPEEADGSCRDRDQGRTSVPACISLAATLSHGSSSSHLATVGDCEQTPFPPVTPLSGGCRNPLGVFHHMSPPPVRGATASSSQDVVPVSCHERKSALAWALPFLYLTLNLYCCRLKYHHTPEWVQRGWHLNFHLGMHLNQRQLEQEIKMALPAIWHWLRMCNKCLKLETKSSVEINGMTFDESILDCKEKQVAVVKKTSWSVSRGALMSRRVYEHTTLLHLS